MPHQENGNYVTVSFLISNTLLPANLRTKTFLIGRSNELYESTCIFKTHVIVLSHVNIKLELHVLANQIVIFITIVTF